MVQRLACVRVIGQSSKRFGFRSLGLRVDGVKSLGAYHYGASRFVAMALGNSGGT